MIDLPEPGRIRRLIEQDAALTVLYERASSVLGADPGHDVHHCLRVADWTLRLAEEPVQPRLAIAAALLHDIVNVPKNSPDRARASELSAERARQWLPEFGYSASEIELVAEAILDHSYSRGAVPKSALGRALQDADRLEALGALGLCRVISTGARMGAAYFDAQDPWATARPLDDRAYSLDHFFTKLLKLPETLHTARGRAEAARRAAFLYAFIDQLGAEIGAPRPV